MMKFIIFMLFSLSVFAGSPLDPRNSKIPTVDFTYKNHEFHVGIWTTIQGDVFALVTDRGDGTYITLGTPRSISMDDIGGQIASFGSIEQYIEYALYDGFISWNESITEFTKSTYPGFGEFIQRNLSFDDGLGELVLD